TGGATPSHPAAPSPCARIPTSPWRRASSSVRGQPARGSASPIAPAPSPETAARMQASRRSSSGAVEGAGPAAGSAERPAGLAVPAQLQAADLAPVDLVGAVGEAEGARVRPPVRERERLA